MADSADAITVEGADPPPKKHWLRHLLSNLIKVIIAIAGVWFVVHSLSWNDTAILAKGDADHQIRGLQLADETEVHVLNITPKPGEPKTLLYQIELPKTIDVYATNAQGLPERLTINDQNRDAYLPRPLPPLPAYLFKQTDGEIVHQGLKSTCISASARWYYLVFAWIILVIPFLVSAFRWRALMVPQGIHVPYGKCLQLTFVGQFFSILLPGITGGDLVKIVYAAKLTGSKTKSFITIILDRVIGLVALMVIAGASAGIQLLLNWHNGQPLDNTLLNVFLLVVGMLFALAVGATIYFSHRLRRLVGIEWFVDHFGADDSEEVRHQKLEHLFRVLNALALLAGILAVALLALLKWGIHLQWAEKNTIMIYIGLGAAAAVVLAAAGGLILHELLVSRMTPLMKKAVATIVRVDETLHVYRGHFGLLAGLFAISLVSQLLLPTSAWLSGIAFGMSANLGYYLAYIPVAVLASSLPIAPPQGIGLLESVVNHFFVNRGGTNSQVFALTQAVRFLPLLWNLVGAYWVLTGKFSRHEVVEEGIEVE